MEETTETDWLSGGATIWRMSVVNASYEEWYIGDGYLEDKEMRRRSPQRICSTS